jgi:hypothetical protein
VAAPTAAIKTTAHAAASTAFIFITLAERASEVKWISQDHVTDTLAKAQGRVEMANSWFDTPSRGPRKQASARSRLPCPDGAAGSLLARGAYGEHCQESEVLVGNPPPSDILLPSGVFGGGGRLSGAGHERVTGSPGSGPEGLPKDRSTDLDVDAPCSTFRSSNTSRILRSPTGVRHGRSPCECYSTRRAAWPTRVPEDDPAQPRSIAARVKSLCYARLVREPGREFHYFNPNYAVPARLVEVVARQPFGAYLHTRTHLRPAGMTETTSVVMGGQGRFAASHFPPGDILAFCVPIAPVLGTPSACPGRSRSKRDYPMLSRTDRPWPG